MTAPTALIRLAVDGAAQVQGALGGVQSSLTNLGGAAQSVGGRLSTLGGAFAALGVGAAAAVFGGWIKGAIDSADAAGKLASSTGLATKELAGLQMAFDDSGVANKFKETLGKLAAEASKGNQAFSAMGLTVTTSSGALKTTRELLAEVSDKFSSYRTSAEKSALAQKLFGESGAELIPLLNGGSAALDEYDQKAQALGLTLSTEAAEAAAIFNDQLSLIAKSSEGLARQFASDLLPVLSTVAEEMGKSAAQGGTFAAVGVGLSRVLETVTLIGSDVAFVFRTIARDALLVYESGLKLAKLDFAGIRSGFAEYKFETDAARKALDQFQAAVVTARTVASAGELDEPWVKRAKAAAQAATESAKAAAPVVHALTNARTGHKKAVDGEAAALKALTQALDTEAKFRQIIINDELKQEKLLSDRMDSTREMLESIERETALMGLSNTEREQSIALFALEKAGVIAGTEAYDAYAAKIREAISARGNKQTALDAVAAETAATAQAAKDATDAWQKTADSINSSLTDALMRGFEDGKGFAKNLRDTLTNMFKTMVLRPIISAVLAPVAGVLSGAANAATGAIGGGGGITSILSSLNSSISTSIGDAFGKFASSSTGQSLGLSKTSVIGDEMGPQLSNSLTANGQMMSQGLQVLGDTMAGYALGSMARTMISGGYSAGKGMDNFQKVGIAVGSALGGPVVGALIGAATGLFNRAFGRKLKDSGVEGTFGGQEGFSGNSFEFLKGGLLRSDKTKTNPLAEEARAALGDAFAGMRVQVGTFASALGLNTDQIAGFTSSIKLSLKGLSEADANKKIEEALAGVSNSLAAQVLGDSGFARAGEAAGATLQRLASSLMTVNAVFDTLGKTALDASLAGGDIASKLADAFGGLEQLASATSTYYEAFYSEQERTETGVRQLTDTLAKLGLALPNTGATDALAQYRALVDAQDINTESGRAAYAALVTLSGGFAQLVTSTESLGRAATATLKNLTDQNRDLRVADFEARGNTAGAAAALGLSPVEAAVFSANAALKRSTEKYISGQQASAARDQQIAGISISGRQAPAASTASDSMASAENSNFAAALARLTGASADLQAQLLDAMGDSVGSAALTRVKELAELTKDLSKLQAAEITAKFDANAALSLQIEQVKKASADAADALQRFTGAMKNLVSEQADLQVDLLRAQGNTTGADALARTNALAGLTEGMAAAEAAKITAQFDNNQAIRDQIKALTDATSAADRLQSAWRGITDSLLSEVERIRGTLAESALDSVAALGARFALATAQARAGDQTAAGNLTGLSGQLLGAAAGEATSRAGLLLMQAQVADSLQTTAGLLGGTVPTLAALPTQPTQNTERLEGLVVTLTDKIANLENRLADIQTNTRRTADVIDGGVVLTEAA